MSANESVNNFCLTQTRALRMLVDFCWKRAMNDLQEAANETNDWLRGFNGGSANALEWVADQLEQIIELDAHEKKTAEAVQENNQPNCNPDSPEVQEASVLCPVQGAVCYKEQSYVLETRWP